MLVFDDDEPEPAATVAVSVLEDVADDEADWDVG